MRFQTFFTQATVFVNKRFKDKRELFTFIAGECGHRCPCSTPERFVELFMQREAAGTTYLGKGIAVPHIFVDDIKEMTVFFIKLAEPLDYSFSLGTSKGGGAPDAEAQFIFTVISPPSKRMQYLQVLAGISRMCMNRYFHESLAGLEQTRDFLNLVDEYDQQYHSY